MTPEERLARTRQICRFVAEWRLAASRSQFPEWTEEEVRREAARRRGGFRFREYEPVIDPLKDG